MSYSINKVDGDAYIAITGDLGTFGDTAAKFKEAVEEVNPAKIFVSLNSDGGDSNWGLEVGRFLETHETEVTVVGHCFSAAASVLLGGKFRRIERGSMIMVHSPVSICMGRPSALRREAKELEKLSWKVRDFLAERTGQSKRTVAQWFKRDTYFTAEQAIKLGFVHEIIEPPPPLPRLSDETAASVALEKGPTEAERMFQTFLGGFGKNRGAELSGVLPPLGRLGVR